jgi:hypothetical protein
MTRPVRVALVDPEPEDLDGFRHALADALPEGEPAARTAEVRLVIAPAADAVAWRWAALAHAARAGEVAALAGAVLEAVVVSGRSPRANAAARLAAALGSRVVELHGAAAAARSAASAAGAPAGARGEELAP